MIIPTRVTVKNKLRVVIDENYGIDFEVTSVLGSVNEVTEDDYK